MLVSTLFVGIPLPGSKALYCSGKIFARWLEPAAIRVQIVASWAAAIAACVGASAAFNLARKR